MLLLLKFLFFFNDTATTEIYTLSLHDALPISFREVIEGHAEVLQTFKAGKTTVIAGCRITDRSEEHTSELQSHSDLVCRLLLEKKNYIHSGGGYVGIDSTIDTEYNYP